MAVTPITDFVARTQAMVLAQYVGLARFTGTVGLLGQAVQDAETGLSGLIASLNLSTASAVWLDRLGAVVDERREGLVDSIFRAFIQGRALANASQGDIPTLYAVANATASALSVTYSITAWPPAGLQMVVTGILGDALAGKLARLMRRARAAGVSLNIIYSTQADASTFFFSTTTSVQASSTQGFGDSGVPATGGGLSSAVGA